MQTRAQKNSQMAYNHISRLELKETEKKQYGGICHEFPIMVLHSGLAQAVAFLWIKAESGKPAYQAFLKHLASIAGHEQISFGAFQQRIHAMELGEYRRTTRTILDAAVWYKRFAESLLGVRAGDSVGDIEADEEGQADA